VHKAFRMLTAKDSGRCTKAAPERSGLHAFERTTAIGT
jgi:hypothetical protein